MISSAWNKAAIVRFPSARNALGRNQIRAHPEKGQGSEDWMMMNWVFILQGVIAFGLAGLAVAVILRHRRH